MQDVIVNVDENEFKAIFNENNFNEININGRTFNIELLNKLKSNIWSVSINNKVCQIEFDLQNNGSSSVFIDGLSFDIKISDEKRLLLQKFIQSASGKEDSDLMKITAPMPGMIVKVLVKDGDIVKKDDGLVIIEAMKMENALKAPKSGKINNIKIKTGSAVEKGAPLMELHI